MLNIIMLTTKCSKGIKHLSASRQIKSTRYTCTCEALGPYPRSIKCLHASREALGDPRSLGGQTSKCFHQAFEARLSMERFRLLFCLLESTFLCFHETQLGSLCSVLISAFIFLSTCQALAQANHPTIFTQKNF